MNNYYYIISSLPALPAFHDLSVRADSSAGLRFPWEKLRSTDLIGEEIAELLDPAEVELFHYIRYPGDHPGILSVLAEEDLTFTNYPGSIYTGLNEPAVLSEKMKTREGLPSYVHEFLEHVSLSEKKFSPNWEAMLWKIFYKEVMSLENDFLRKWFSFERDFTSVLTALECRAQGIPLEKREITRDSEKHAQPIQGNYELRTSLWNSTGFDFGLSGQYDWMERVLNAREADILTREYEMDRIRWDKLEEFAGPGEFTLENIMAYYIKAGILSRWKNIFSPDVGDVVDVLSKAEHRHGVNDAFNVDLEIQSFIQHTIGDGSF